MKYSIHLLLYQFRSLSCLRSTWGVGGYSTWGGTCLELATYRVLVALVGGGGERGLDAGSSSHFAGSSSRTRSHIFSGSAALKTIRSRMLNYGKYHGKYMIINTNSARSHRQLYDYGVFIRPPKYKYEVSAQVREEEDPRGAAFVRG